jgi:hypothetical protein
MKVVEIVPRERTRLYGTLVAKEEAIRKGGRGTYVRVGRKRRDAARWKHKNYRGSVALKRGDAESSPPRSRAANPRTSASCCRRFDLSIAIPDRVASINIHYRWFQSFESCSSVRSPTQVSASSASRGAASASPRAW